MDMPLSATKLRQDLYHFLDSVLETGVPIEIERKGKKLKIILAESKNKLDNLEKHDLFQCDPEDLIYLDHSREWKQEPNFK